MKKKLAGIFFCVFTSLLHCQCAIANAVPDSTVVHVRHFDAHALEQYKNQSDFKYETVRPEGFSLWDWIGYLIEKFLIKIFSSHSSVSMLRVLFYGFMVSVAVIIILNLMGIDIKSFFIGKPTEIISHQLIEENVRELNLDQLITEAINNKQWRLATRYQYLKALRLLTDKDLIHWQAGKTNMDYYYELKAGSLRDVFLNVTGVFENAWYGQQDLNITDYQLNSAGFEQFYNQINNYRS